MLGINWSNCKAVTSNASLLTHYTALLARSIVLPRREERGMYITGSHRSGFFFLSFCLIFLLAGCFSSTPPVTSVPASSSLAGGTILHIYRSHFSIFGIAWSPDGKRIASG